MKMAPPGSISEKNKRHIFFIFEKKIFFSGVIGFDNCNHFLSKKHFILHKTYHPTPLHNVLWDWLIYQPIGGSSGKNLTILIITNSWILNDCNWQCLGIFYFFALNTYFLSCIHACMHTCMHAHMHTCIHAYMHTCIHTYIHTNIQPYGYKAIYA